MAKKKHSLLFYLKSTLVGVTISVGAWSMFALARLYIEDAVKFLGVQEQQFIYVGMIIVCALFLIFLRKDITAMFRRR